MAYERTFKDVQVRSSDIGIRTIGFGDLWRSLREGYDDFNASPTTAVFLTVLFPLFVLLLTLFLVGGNLLHMAFPVVAGLTLIGPVVSVWLFEMSRRRERGLDFSWGSTFDFIHSAAFAPILALSVLMMLLYVGWLYMAQFLYFGLFADDAPVSASAFVWIGRRVHIRFHRAGDFGRRLSVASRQAGKRRHGRRRFDPGCHVQSDGDGGVGADRHRAAGRGGDRVPGRTRRGPTHTGPRDVASLPQGRRALKRSTPTDARRSSGR